MVKEKRKPKMTWARLRLLCEAVRRITRFADSTIGGSYHGLGYPTDYSPVTKAKWMRPIREEQPREMRWYRLTPEGQAIVNRMLNAGLTYKHIEAGTKSAPSKPASKAELIGDVCYDIRSLFSNPEKYLSTHLFNGANLPDLDIKALEVVAPRSNHG